MVVIIFLKILNFTTILMTIIYYTFHLVSMRVTL